MTELYIIAGIIGYLLVGEVLCGILFRLKWIDGDDPTAIIGILTWPTGVALVIAIGICRGLIWIAKKIGGVK